MINGTPVLNCHTNPTACNSVELCHKAYKLRLLLCSLYFLVRVACAESGRDAGSSNGGMVASGDLVVVVYVYVSV